LIRTGSSSPLYPIKANNRYLVDQNNQPFLVIGDAPHTLLVNLTDADARSYYTVGFSSGWQGFLNSLGARVGDPINRKHEHGPDDHEHRGSDHQ